MGGVEKGKKAGKKNTSKIRSGKNFATEKDKRDGAGNASDRNRD